MKSAPRIVTILLLATLLIGRHGTAAADEPDRKGMSVPVRVLAPPAERPGAMPPDAAPQERLAMESSGGLPPQYRPGPNGTLDGIAAANDPTVRFIVPLVERPVLVEARIMIDGQPFRMARERRIGRLLDQVAEPVATPPAVDSALDNSLPGRLGRYVQSTQRPPTCDEIRWILANWVDGPTLLVLNESFQAARAHQSPLFKVLDRDEDGVISAAELARAEETLLRYDRNQDGVLSFEEIAAAAKRTPAEAGQPALDPAPLIPPDELANGPTFRRLARNYATSSDSPSDIMRRFDPDGNGQVDKAELLELHGSEPDLLIDVAFDTSDPTRSRLDIVSLRIPTGQVTTSIHAGAITVNIAGTLLEIAAVQSARAASDQISIGAVRDGYPLLPTVDRNEDGRLTARELRQVAKLVAEFDRDQDGRLSAAELLPTMRVTFGHGPTAHQPLAMVRSVYPPIASTPLAPPEWFVRMDRNQDGDLTPNEFLGSKEQFEALDLDGDGLISVAEALARE